MSQQLKEGPETCKNESEAGYEMLSDYRIVY